MKRIFLFIAAVYLLTCQLAVNAATVPVVKQVSIVVSPNAHARVKFGAQKLTEILKKAGYTVKQLQQAKVISGNAPQIIIGNLNDALLKSASTLYRVASSKTPGKEGFNIQSLKSIIVISGVDNSGALYGCLELAERIKDAKGLPATISITDKPEMVLRGACIGVQKPVLMPGRGVYEYPYTPENFPWFYDKQLWIRYLDSMVNNRMNSLYLWNGHPFASLVKLKDYPYAVEVDEATFKKNEEMFSFLTQEADKRGIWVIQMFYNIIVSKPFAEKNHIKTQDRNRPIVPLIADYTRKSIAAFVEKYPNVGLMVALGEAMEGVGQDDIDWFTKTIIPGVKDGLKALGKTEEPPIVLRAHDTDAPAVMKNALPLYKNLYTEAKYNGEALTTYTPRGPWAELHRTLSRIGTVQIENVHILANLEPFRYGSADFIQKCVQAMHSVYESNGLHLYPESSYWDWPYTADKADKRLLQLDRDWLWYKEWARYAWNCHRDRNEEIKYWSKQIAGQFGSTEQSGKYVLDAYEETGEIAPKLLRRYGITDGNRQTLTLGMLMSQLVNPEKFGLFTLLYNSEGPEGEMLSEYAEKDWRGQPHIGETPVQVMNDVVAHGRKAIDAIEKATPGIKTNKAEFNRLKNDVYCYNALANSYSEKARAALAILRYKYTNDVADLEKALPAMEKSLEWFRKLADLTKGTYLYANSMQTKQRKIPVGGNDGKMKTWVELLPVYERELGHFKKNIDSLKSPSLAKKGEKLVLANADITLQNGKFYTIDAGARPFADTAATITEFAPELKGLKGVQLSKETQVAQGSTITFTTNKPVKVLVGYFTQKGAFVKSKGYLPEPELETDASANDYGQSDVKIANAMVVPGLPPVNVHTFSYKAGTHTLTLGKGASLILGFVDDKQAVPVYDAGLSQAGNIKDLRWLFN